MLKLIPLCRLDELRESLENTNKIKDRELSQHMEKIKAEVDAELKVKREEIRKQLEKEHAK